LSNPASCGTSQGERGRASDTLFSIGGGTSLRSASSGSDG
jgi:hypothetical protein